MTDEEKTQKRRHKMALEKIEYDPAHLLRVWSSLPNPTAEGLHKALNAQGMKCSLSWVKHKIAKHHIVAIAKTGTQDATLVNIRAIRAFLEDVGKDMVPHAMLAGLQTRTIVLLNDHLSKPDKGKADPEWLQEMMKFYKQLTDELLHTYQKRKEAGEDLKLPERKPDAGEVVTPFTGRRK